MTNINWPDLTVLGNATIGRSPTRSLDHHKISDRDISAFIASLKELKVAGAEPRKSIIEATFQLHHASLSFLVDLDEREIEYMRNFEGLTTTIFNGQMGDNRLFYYLHLTTGTLAQWKQAILENTDDSSDDPEIALKRLYFTQIYFWFKKLNLKELFGSYNEKSWKDGTVILEHR